MKHWSCLAVGMLLAGCMAAPAAPRVTPAASPSASPTSLVLRQNTGLVSTLAVAGGYLEDFTVDEAGNLYLSELTGIRKVAPDGASTLIARAASGANAAGVDPATTITEPRGITRDRQGNLYVLGLRHLYKLAPSGQLTSVGGLDLDIGERLAVDSHGNAFVASLFRDTITKITPDGQVSPFAGRWIKDAPPGRVGSGYQDGPGAQALFRMPSDIAIDAQDNLYVADSNNGALRKIDPAGNVSTLVGQGKDLPLPPSPAPGAPTPDLSPYLAGRLSIRAVTVDSAGTLYTAGTDNRIRRISPQGELSVLAGDGTICPHNATTAGGAIISNNPAVASPSPTPTPPRCDLDGPGTAARFDEPQVIRVDGAGRLYVMDGGPNFTELRIRRID